MLFHKMIRLITNNKMSLRAARPVQKVSINVQLMKTKEVIWSYHLIPKQPTTD